MRADNPGPMTLEGTNTWVLRAPGASGSVVVDPGPLDEAHLEAVAAYAPVELILLTHSHPDHAEGAHRLREMTCAPLAAADPAYVVDAEPLIGGRGIDAAGLRLDTIATPGHTRDSVSFLVSAGEGDTAVLTGDTVLGRGTTVVAHPDGKLADYLRSLELLRDLGPIRALPGHGPVRPDTAAVALEYLEHRRARLAQVEAALAEGATTARDVVRRVYSDIDPRLEPAAELSVRAQLDYLRDSVR